MLALLGLVLSVVPTTAQAQGIPKVSVEVGETEDPSDLSTTLQIVILLTVLSLAPSILIMVTRLSSCMISSYPSDHTTERRKAWCQAGCGRADIGITLFETNRT